MSSKELNLAIFASACVLVIVTFAPTPSVSEEMPLSDVPDAIMDAAKQAASGIEFDKAGIETEDGVATYELTGKNAEGMMVEVDVLEDGSVVETELQIKENDVPDAVIETLNRYLPSFQAEFIELSERPAANWYEFSGKNEGAEFDVEIDSDARRILIQDDSAG